MQSLAHPSSRNRCAPIHCGRTVVQDGGGVKGWIEFLKVAVQSPRFDSDATPETGLAGQSLYRYLMTIPVARVEPPRNPIRTPAS